MGARMHRVENYLLVPLMEFAKRVDDCFEIVRVIDILASVRRH